MEVIINRSKEYSKSIKEVVSQNNQFSVYNQRRFNILLENNNFSVDLSTPLYNITSGNVILSPYVRWFRNGNRGWHARALTYYKTYRNHSFFKR